MVGRGVKKPAYETPRRKGGGTFVLTDSVAEYARRKQCKLTEDQRREIIIRHAQGVPQKVLALDYKVAPSTIHNVVRKKSWRPKNG